MKGLEKARIFTKSKMGGKKAKHFVLVEFFLFLSILGAFCKRENLKAGTEGG